MIDIRTLMLVLAIGNIGFAMVMSGYARSNRRQPALRLWCWAKFVQGMAHLLGWLQPLYPNALPWPALHSLLAAGLVLEVGACCCFFGYARWRRLLYSGFGMALVAYHGAAVAGVAPQVMTALTVAMFAALIGAMGVLLLRQPGASALQKIVGFNDLAFAGVLVLLGYARLGGIAAFDFNAMVQLTYLTGYLLMVVNSFGFLLVCKERDDAKLAELATIDSLTGLLNRRAFFEEVERARLQALRYKQSVAMLMLDIDYFKRLNDRYGHAAGDHALCAFAATARGILREHDILGRLGGEEFALLLPATDVVGAMQAAERLRMSVESSPISVENETVVLTVSIGVVMVDAAEHINQAMARADHALYIAKSGGRNRVEVGLVKRRCA